MDIANSLEIVLELAKASAKLGTPQQQDLFDEAIETIDELYLELREVAPV